MIVYIYITIFPIPGGGCVAAPGAEGAGGSQGAERRSAAAGECRHLLFFFFFKKKSCFKKTKFLVLLKIKRGSEVSIHDHT